MACPPEDGHPSQYQPTDPTVRRPGIELTISSRKSDALTTIDYRATRAMISIILRNGEEQWPVGRGGAFVVVAGCVVSVRLSLLFSVSRS